MRGKKLVDHGGITFETQELPGAERLENETKPETKPGTDNETENPEKPDVSPEPDTDYPTNHQKYRFHLKSQIFQRNKLFHDPTQP